MSEMKKMAALLDSYDNLPNDKFKEEIKDDMNKLKKLLNYDDYNDTGPNNPDDGSWKDR